MTPTQESFLAHEKKYISMLVSATFILPIQDAALLVGRGVKVLHGNVYCGR